MENDFENFTIKLAIFDCIPVLFFFLNTLCISLIFNSFLFKIGAFLCVLAGLLKVIWKFIIAIKKKNISILSYQMRYMMPLGFLIMACSFYRDGDFFFFDQLTSLLKVPYIYMFFVVGIIGLFCMTFLAKKLNQNQSKSNWIEEILNIFIQLCFLIGVAQICYFMQDYKAIGVESYLQSHDKVEVTKIKEGYYFNGSSNDKALIFYPGAKVETISYAPLLYKLSLETGMDCFLMDMPCEFAIYGMNKANDIIAQYDYSSYYMAGHSLGGAMACSYAKKHANKIDGLVLLGAYVSTDLSETTFPVVEIVGSEDQVINKEKLEKGHQYTKHLHQRIIKGGNHAGFGSYGKQKGDGEALISNEAQWNETIQYIKEGIQ